MTHVYIAASYGRRVEMVGRAKELRERGHVSTASWIEGKHESLDTSSDFGGRAAEFATDDIWDIVTSEWIVMFTDPPGTPARGGRHFELGYALGMRHFADGEAEVAIIGEPENVFHSLPEIHYFPSWEAFLEELGGAR